MSDGTVMCWGYNHDLQINAGTFGSTHTATPAWVAGAVAVTAGAYHSCALLGNGSAACWGYNHDGETGTSPTPSNTIAISARQIDAATGAGVQGTTAQGGYHTCAVLTNGSVSCWGYNGYGELGNGTTSGPQPVGTAVTTAGLTGPASSVAAGGYHTNRGGSCHVLGSRRERPAWERHVWNGLTCPGCYFRGTATRNQRRCGWVSHLRSLFWRHQ
jgi:alpha-tubulin suppressor-like RCC1 family protein